MRIERLFQALVLGGAALSGACTGEDDGQVAESGKDAGPGGASGGSTSGTGGEAAGGTGGRSGSGGGGSGGSGGAGGSIEDAAPADAAQTDTTIDDAASSDVADAGRPVCSSPADPGDPCGCQCCWAGPGCGNDEPCCHGFCVSGNRGLGCCPAP